MGILERKAGASSVDPDDFNAAVDAVVALGGAVATRKAGAAVVDTDDFNAVIDAAVSLGEALATRKAGAAAVDPDDFNALIDGIATLQAGPASPTIEEAVTLATGENQIHALGYTAGKGLWATTRTSPAKVLKWPDPSDLATYSVLTFPNTGNDLNANNGADAAVWSETRGKLLVSFTALSRSSPSEGFYVRVREVDLDAMTSSVLVDYNADVDFNQGTPEIACDDTHVYMITAPTLTDARILKFALTDGSFVDDVTITGRRRGHPICLDDDYVYVGGSVNTPWLARAPKDLSTHTSIEVSAVVGEAITDDMFVDDTYLYAGVEVSTGRALRVAKDLTGNIDVVDHGFAATNCYGVFPDTDSASAWAVFGTSPGVLVKFSRSDLTVLETVTLDTGQNSANELVAVGNDLYVTCFLSPSQVIRIGV